MVVASGAGDPDAAGVPVHFIISTHASKLGIFSLWNAIQSRNDNCAKSGDFAQHRLFKLLTSNSWAGDADAAVKS